MWCFAFWLVLYVEDVKGILSGGESLVLRLREFDLSGQQREKIPSAMQVLISLAR